MGGPIATILLVLQSSFGAHGWVVPLPGGRKVSMGDDGILRIQLENVKDQPVIPPIGTGIAGRVIGSIEIRDTGNPKGWGAFCVSKLARHEFLGFYDGKEVQSIDSLLNREYIMAIKGGVAYLDGFERSQNRNVFSPVHLNHADKSSSDCNCLRVLCEDNANVAFFTSRTIQVGEELCFDYGQNYWVGREHEKI